MPLQHSLLKLTCPLPGCTIPHCQVCDPSRPTCLVVARLLLSKNSSAPDHTLCSSAIADLRAESVTAGHRPRCENRLTTHECVLLLTRHRHLCALGFVCKRGGDRARRLSYAKQRNKKGTPHQPLLLSIFPCQLLPPIIHGTILYARKQPLLKRLCQHTSDWSTVYTTPQQCSPSDLYCFRFKTESVDPEVHVCTVPWDANHLHFKGGSRRHKHIQSEIKFLLTTTNKIDIATAVHPTSIPSIPNNPPAPHLHISAKVLGVQSG